MDEVLTRIACHRLPPVYPRLLELTDADPGVGVSSVAEEEGLQIDDSPAPQGYVSAFLVPENQFFYNREYLKEYLGVTNNQKSSVPGHGYFSKLESLHCEKGELHMEYRRMWCQERNGQLCKFYEKNETTSSPLPTR